MCKTGQGKNLTYSSLWAKERDFLSFDQLIDEESMDFFQSDEYLMMSKHLNPSFSEGKVSFQVSLLFLVFGPLNQTGRATARLFGRFPWLWDLGCARGYTWRGDCISENFANSEDSSHEIIETFASAR